MQGTGVHGDRASRFLGLLDAVPLQGVPLCVPSFSSERPVRSTLNVHLPVPGPSPRSLVRPRTSDRRGTVARHPQFPGPVVVDVGRNAWKFGRLTVTLGAHERFLRAWCSRASYSTSQYRPEGRAGSMRRGRRRACAVLKYMWVAGFAAVFRGTGSTPWRGVDVEAARGSGIWKEKLRVRFVLESWSTRGERVWFLFRNEPRTLERWAYFGEIETYEISREGAQGCGGV